MQNKAKVKIGKINLNIDSKRIMKIYKIGHLVKTNPICSELVESKSKWVIIGYKYIDLYNAGL
jgi:hypothetical protein